ncbi:cation diffusion facilitator family transporter [Desulfocurvus sp.]|jgi:cation diffusion facilitator family transporter|uniref:cation diffusion facilitator family transporter n=1 Tax=Desulfocurvus sp. TaxID=2871698 RepID=UPI0025BD0AA2|nr:cation diffusion facilitator family transporter [Desulfocurvus sp.]MCK9238782.1 cation diffusion facilitator family transporter [Desulfocurvus sp.]
MSSPVRYAYYSIAASVLTLGLKFGAWTLTGSVGLLSDATESLVNLAAGMLALWALLVAVQPADDGHAYGHGKAEYFSSGAEGVLIIVAAGGIVWAAVGRFLDPQPLDRLGLGLVMALAASAVNWFTARGMLRAARRYDSITLEADARHLMTDVWTSAGLVAGLAVLLVAPPSWAVLDPIIAVVMAANIVVTGVGLVRRSLGGLMDKALPEDEMRAIHEAIRAVAGQGALYHGLRTRKSGPRRFVDFHLLVPGATSVARAHTLCDAVELSIVSRLPGTLVTIHVEPEEEPASFDGHAVGGACAGGGDCGSCPGAAD